MNERIKAIRKAKGLTQQEFADQLGIKRGAVANYELGRNNPIDAVVSLICRVFNVNERYLRYGEEPMFVIPAAGEFEALARRYPQMTEESRIFIEKLISLPSADQDKVMSFLRSVVADFPEKKPGAAPDPGGLSREEAMGAAAEMAGDHWDMEKEAEEPSAVS